MKKVVFVIYILFCNITYSQNRPDYQLFLDDSLILSGNLESRYASRPTAIIDIDDRENLKKMTFIFNICNTWEPRIDFKEKDSTIFIINGYYHAGDTLIYDPYFGLSELRSKNYKRIKGKTVQLYYRNEGFQKTPTLLGTLIVKND